MTFGAYFNESDKLFSVWKRAFVKVKLKMKKVAKAIKKQ
jgi:hypothetical protein